MATHLSIGHYAVLLLLTLFHAHEALSLELDDSPDRLGTMDNVTIKYKRVDTFSPPAEMAKTMEVPNSLTVLKVKTGVEKYQCVFRYYRGRLYYSKTRTDKVADGELRTTVIAVSADRREEFSQKEGAECGRGAITRDRDLPNEQFIDIALGLRAYSHRKWIDSQQMFGTSDDPLGVEVNGIQVLDYIDDKGRKSTWEFDRSLGDSLTKYTCGIEGRTYASVVNSGFERVDNLLLPFEIQATEYRWHGGEQAVSRTAHLTVEEYVLDDPENVSYDFRIRWPLKSQVLDVDTMWFFRLKAGSEAR